MDFKRIINIREHVEEEKKDWMKCEEDKNARGQNPPLKLYANTSPRLLCRPLCRYSLQKEGRDFKRVL